MNNKNASRTRLRLTLVSLALVSSACGTKLIPESRKVHKAPSRQSETGVIVSGLSEEQMSQLLEKDEQLKVRIVNPAHNLYEVHGASESQIKEMVQNAGMTNVIVEKNHFKKMNVFRTNIKGLLNIGGRHPFVEAIEENQNVKLEGELSTFVNSCKLNKFTAPNIVVSADKGRDRTDAGILFDVGQSINLDATPSQAKGTAKQLNFMWIVTAPEDSALTPIAAFKSKVTYQPDATGMYIYSVVAKDELGFCQLDMQPFYVTANYQFDPSQSLPDNWYERVDANTFWHIFHVGSQQSWTRAVGRNQVVGVIDSGVDYNHPALAQNIMVNKREIPGNGIDDDGNSFVDDVTGYDFGNDDAYPVDDYGHGTHVAGIAASHVFGAARKARILPTKFGSGVGFDIASITGAIKYSVDNGATVLNMSFGWEEDMAVVREAMNYAERKNVLVVAASGNDGANNENVGSFPCNYPNANIISVAASDENDRLTFYSNYGQNVHIAAPGGTPEKPIMSSYKKNPKDSQIVGLMGTSMASPLVAGVAAQVWSARPELTAVQVKNLLLQSGRPAPGIGKKILTGKVIDTAAALDLATGTGLGSSSSL